MADTIFSTTIANGLKETLEDVIDDHTDGIEESMMMSKVFDERPMGDAYLDFLETGGMGLAHEVDEGEEIPSGTIQEGWLARFIARKVGIRLVCTDEALEDNKYEEIIAQSKRLKRSLFKTFEIDAANVFNRMFNSAYVGGDGLELSSTAHTLPGGGTWSNEMASPIGPSEASFITAQAQAEEYPGHDGVTGDNYKLDGVIFPHGQRGAWDTLLGSEYGPETNNFAAINVAYSKRSGLKSFPLVHWTASDSSYCYRTNVDSGFVWFWRRRPKSRSWVGESQELMYYSQTARIARGWIDPRCSLGVEA